MEKFLRLFPLVCIAVFWTNLVFGQGLDTEIMQLAEQATVENFPEAGAVILLDEIEATVKPDGSATFRLHRAAKILNDRGKSFGEVSLSYNKAFENIVLNFARTIKKDGSILPVSEDAIQDSSPYVSYPLYSDIMVKRMSLPGIEPEAIVEYEAEIQELMPIIENGFNSIFHFRGFSPYLLQRVAIHTPILLEGKFIANRFQEEPPPQIQTDNDYKTYTWEIRDTEEIVYEPLMPPLYDISPYIVVSTIKKWETIGNWYNEISKEQTTADEKIKDRVKEITAGLDSEQEKIEAIYYFILQNIRYVAVELADSAFRPHSAATVYQNRYGDCKDKVTLLIAMLKEIGVPCYYALIRTKDKGKMDLVIPTLAFNHMIGCIPRGDGYIFVDPTAETAMFGNLPSVDQGVEVLIVKEEPELVKTDVFEPDKNSMLSTAKMRINPDLSLDYAEKMEVTGENDTYWRSFVRFNKPVDLKNFFQTIVNNISPGAKLNGYDVGNYQDMKAPMQIKLNFSNKDFATRAGKLVSFSIPGSDTFAAGFVGLEERKFPIQYNSLSKMEAKTLILIPEGYKIKHLPEDLFVEFPSGCFMAGYKEFGNKIVYKAVSLTDKLQVEVQDYQKYKAMMERIARNTKAQIILEAP